MEGLRKLVNIIVLLFVLFAVLLLLNVISIDYLDSTFTSFNPENFYRTIFGIAAILLLIHLVVSNLNILSLKKERTMLNNRINELKASLYDKRIDEARDIRPLNPDTDQPDPLYPPTII